MLGLLKTLSFVIGHLPPFAGRALGALLGSLAYAVLKRHRRTVSANLERAFGAALSKGERERVARAVFRNLATMFFEFTRLPWLNKGALGRLVEFRGLERIDRALERGKGGIILTAHFGNWELMGVALGLMGYNLDVVVREIDNPVFEEFVAWVRTRSGNSIIYKKRSMRKLMKSLSDNSLVAILVDQNVTHREGVFVDFFGSLACTNKGPALLAKASGTAVLPVFIRRDGARHILEVLEEIEPVDTGDRERDAITNTALFTAAVEAHIRRYPEEWFWVHRRWKTRPETAEQFTQGAQR